MTFGVFGPSGACTSMPSLTPALAAIGSTFASTSGVSPMLGADDGEAELRPASSICGRMYSTLRSASIQSSARSAMSAFDASEVGTRPLRSIALEQRAQVLVGDLVREAAEALEADELDARADASSADLVDQAVQRVLAGQPLVGHRVEGGAQHDAHWTTTSS